MKKTVLIDTNNIAIRCLYGDNVLTKEGKEIVDINWDLWKLYLFSSIYDVFYKIKDVSEIVLAVDSSKYWRKIYYPNYKYKRASQREKSGIDWDTFFLKYKAFQDEIKKHLPIKVLNILYTEGDDIIGSIVTKSSKKQKFHIISVDSDFLQLSAPNVTIYNPLKKTEVSHPNPEMFIKELCLTGQAKDGIYNIITPVDWPKEIRLPGFGPKAAEKVFIQGIDEFLKGSKKYIKKYKKEGSEEITVYEEISNYQKRFAQNKILIDFKLIPEDISAMVMKQYRDYKYPSPEKILEFFQLNDWREFNDDFTKVETNLMELY